MEQGIFGYILTAWACMVAFVVVGVVEFIVRQEDGMSGGF